MFSRSQDLKLNKITMKITAIVQFLWVLIAWSGLAVTCSFTSGNETDRLSLLDFKKAIVLDSQQALISWNESTHYCHWEGVLCTANTPPRVISLDLTNQGLLGPISPSLGNLTLLTNLSLSSNRFTGQIPPSLGHLHHLQRLYLSNNTLEGIISDFTNCSNLKALWLNGNNLVGQFPGLPPHLQELNLALNNLTGNIPSSLANITTLLRFSCVFNNIKGNIPNEFAKFPSLQTLLVNRNQLSGRFPQAILNISTLISLGLEGQKHLSGEVPPDLGSSLPNLQWLQLGGNYFQGLIPPSLNNASNLYDIDLSANNFTGVVPSTLSKLTQLSTLNLELNRLQARSKQDWEFLSNLANCTKLQVISLAFNQLEGQVPSSLGNLSFELQRLYLGNNQLSGDFPSGIKNLPNLIILGLENNQFTGMVPGWLGTIKKLQGVDLSRNKLSGPIPSTLSNISQLTMLLLDSNQFDGQIPSSYGDLQVLETLSISNNILHGIVPMEIFTIPTIRQVDLSFNNLDGQVPTEIGNARQLITLHLSSNKLYGDIPNTLGNCESLEEIKLDRNLFNGSIPSSLGNIRSLKVLNLSHNNLTGSIPLPLGNLQLLQQLDLSFNRLKGEIPTKGIFENATAVRIDGNPGLCGGALEFHRLACSVMPLSSSKHKKYLALKVMIPLVSMVSLAMVIYGLLIVRQRKNRASISSPSFESKFPRVSYSDLVRATEGFSASSLIGKGRYSSVYRGKLFQDSLVVAIKVLSLETREAHKSFMAECNALRNRRHRNLVPILTACSSIDYKGNDFKALVYEFMPRGDLHALLYMNRDDANTSTRSHITLAQRLSIVVDVADALEYLHHNNQGSIVHCDLKPSNILLDDNMTAHVGDFGLAKFKVDSTASSFGDSISTSSVAIRGTIGYVAPECATACGVSSAGDVYSFGIVLLEIFLRKRPTDDMFNDRMNIVKFVETNFPARILRIVDPELLEEQNDSSRETSVSMKEKSLECLLSVINIGLDCTKSSPNERMGMQEVAAKLHGIKEAYLKGNTDPSGQ
ncbi:unnamed protein product [Urochloa decumbens]|uniref:Receptor kinase-like protein Xa21 n=1 Tax=Urochloa decumbens TaxID=240449 RepID=A0ABC8VHU9_9POAL